MIRYLFILLAFSFILGGCSLPGVQDESGDMIENTVLFENEKIQILVPKTWSGRTSLGDGAPPRIGSFVAAFVSTDVKNGFSNNLLILEDTLDRIITSKKYSELNNLQTKKNYLDYTKIKESDFLFTDSETSKIYIFESKYNQTTPKMKFIQTARVCGSKVYLLHFSLSLDKNPDIYSKLLESFTCK